MLEFPFGTGLIIYSAFISLVLALLTFVALIINRIKWTVQRAKGARIKRISITQNSFRFIVVIIWILASAAFLFLGAFIQSYQNFTRQKLIAEVRCVPLADSVKSMHLEITAINSAGRQGPRRFILNGDQWAVEGNVLKWDDWLNFAGLHTMYKITRVRGRYVSVEDERSQIPSVYSLVEPEETSRWRWLFRYGHQLRFVDAVYGNTVFTYPSKKNVYEIYVTTSGFIAKVKEE